MNPSSSRPAASSVRHDAEVIGLVGLAHGTSHFFHLMLPPLFPWLMKDFDLSYTEVGLLMTTFFVISGIGQALAGFVVDKTGSRPVLFFGIGLLALSGVILGLSNSYAMLMVTAAVAGLGNSIFHPADFTLLNHRVAQPRLGHAFSMHGLSGNLGWAAAPVFMAGVATFAGWQAAGFAAAGVGAIVLAILFWRRAMLTNAAAELVVPSHAQTVAAEKPAANQFGFLRSTPVWLCFAFFFFSTASFGILQNFAPAILGNVYGMSLVVATSTLTAYLLGSAAGTITGGFLASRNERNERLIAIALAFSASMALLLASGQIAAALVFPVMALMGFGVGTSGPNRDLLVRRAATGQFGQAAFGRIYGFVYSGLDVGLALSPLVFGPMLDAGRFQAALVAVAILLVAALLMAMRIASATRSAAVAA
ncbi:MAG TPA: MFS transporter [Burkholderiaceae bacterium]|jgi:MFS family permease|nr:MFS transporter [Burkholderiaceae bacterium]